MQTNIARAADYDQACTAGNTRTTILIVDDDTTARLTLSAMISNEDEYRVFLGTGAAEARERLPRIYSTPARMRSPPNRSTPRSYGLWSTLPPGRAGSIRI